MARKPPLRTDKFAALWRIAAPVHPIRSSNCAESGYCELIRPPKGLTTNNEAGQRAETAWAKRQKRNLSSKRADLNGVFRADVVSTRLKSFECKNPYRGCKPKPPKIP